MCNSWGISNVNEGREVERLGVQTSAQRMRLLTFRQANVAEEEQWVIKTREAKCTGEYFGRLIQEDCVLESSLGDSVT